MGTTKVRFSVTYEQEFEVSSMRQIIEAGTDFSDQVAKKIKIDIDDTMNGGSKFQVNEDTVAQNPVALSSEEIAKIFESEGWGDDLDIPEVADRW